MIRRLRLSFVLVNMAIAAALLCAVIGTVLHFTRENLAAKSVQAMEAAAMEPPGLRRPGRGPEEPALPCFTLRPEPDGALSVWGDGWYDLTDEAYLRQVLSAALAAGGETGVLEEWGLRYLRLGPPDRPVLVFADVSGERGTMAGLLRTCLLAGVAGLLAFLAVSVLLSRWAVGPVERAWAQQRQFVADASHELKTPLTVILTNAELLEEEGQGRLAGNILVMARRMRGLVEDLLQLARTDGGLAEAAMEPVALDRLVSDGVLPFEPALFERGLTLEVQAEESLWVRGSGEHLARVVDVLLDNARKYAAPPGTVRVTLERSGRSGLLRVFTPGEPLAGEALEDVFKRFYRADPVRRTEEGSGLGLAIARGIVEAHGGRMWAESDAAGNTFLVRLPLERRKGM